MCNQTKSGLAPIIDTSTRILILGSLPGDESLMRQQYYASNTNDFWKLVAAAIDIDLVDRSYSEKTSLLKESGLGLWDVFHLAVRPGSADQNFAWTEPNDFSILRREAPDLAFVYFNGHKAGKSQGLLRILGYRTTILPSSSGANRRNQSARQAAWRRALRTGLDIDSV